MRTRQTAGPALVALVFAALVVLIGGALLAPAGAQIETYKGRRRPLHEHAPPPVPLATDLRSNPHRESRASCRRRAGSTGPVGLPGPERPSSASPMTAFLVGGGGRRARPVLRSPAAQARRAERSTPTGT